MKRWGGHLLQLVKAWYRYNARVATKVPWVDGLGEHGQEGKPENMSSLGRIWQVSRAWWHSPLIPALGRQRQVDF